jgi:predicted peptidase
VWSWLPFPLQVGNRDVTEVPNLTDYSHPVGTSGSPLPGLRATAAIAAVLLGSASCGGRSTQRDPPSATRLTKQVATVAEGDERYAVNYWQYLPPPSFDGKPAVLVFLHGYGERAFSDGPDELGRVLLHGPPKLAKNGVDLCFGRGGSRSCFILLAPQAPPRHDWYGPSLAPIVDAMIDRGEALGGDMSRVYLTGLSMGGAGTWSYAGSIDFAGRNGATRLAAILPIAGTAPAFTGCRIAAAGVAVWAFHGAADGVVDPSGSKSGVAEVNRCTKPRPKEPALLTLYPGVHHDSWTRTYDPDSHFDPRTGRPDAKGANVYEWLLRHHRPED